ncbi:desaturase [Corallococcus sp. H22C18031201]|uniref:NAD(P)-binding protein n=1 Tax=Citreicoccus inhibens TaxID=2849499 RepID=UPI000E710566|nr:NAD(P)-binding protein [Citreicoccus inhibens]MBU8898200.1 desaturase [Citreicoccus inhibens]RJS26936.1 desaturase [Corallococcus sp. H22C18031201]
MATSTAKLKLSSGPSRHVYDVIVLGSQLGGALTAALLAKRNHRVLLVEHDGMGPGYEHDGFLLPYAPFVAPPLKAMPAVEEALTELGLATHVGRALRPHVPELQLVMPRHRVDLSAEPNRRRAELTREFGDAAEGVLGALAGASAQHEATDAFFKANPQLPPDGFFESWGLKSLIKNHPGLEATPRLGGDDPAVSLVRGLLPFLVHLDKPSSPLAQSRPLSQVLTAPSTYPGGMDALRDALTRRLAELGGDVLSRDNASGFIVEELSFDGSKFAGVKLMRSDTLYRASCLVAATDTGALRRLVTDKKHHRALLEHLDQSTPKSILFAVNWVVPEAALPRGLGELALVDTQDAELGPLLVQQHPARTAPGGATKESKDVDGVRVICAGAFVPASARDLGEEHLQGLAARIDEHLERLMPFTVQHRALRSAPYLDAGGVRGSRLMPHPLYAFETEAFLGITGLKQRTPAKNVILAGREVLPGLGLEGELLAGMRAARLVQEMLKKKDPLKG